MLLQLSHQIIPALSAFLIHSESASLPFYSLLTASTSHSDHQKKSILSPVSFTPIHYGPINLPKGQSSEKFQCLSPQRIQTNISSSFSAVWLSPKLSSCINISLHLSVPCFSQIGLLIISQTDILFLYLCTISFFLEEGHSSRSSYWLGFFYLPAAAQDATSLMISWLLPLGSD